MWRALIRGAVEARTAARLLYDTVDGEGTGTWKHRRPRINTLTKNFFMYFELFFILMAKDRQIFFHHASKALSQSSSTLSIDKELSLDQNSFV